MTLRWTVIALLWAVGCGPRPMERTSAGSREAARGPEAEAEAEAPTPPVEGDRPPPRMAPVLEAHNRARARHCAPPLAWSEELESRARAWAERLASRGCRLEHSTGPLGENLAMGTSGALDAEGVVDRWVREKEEYDFRRGGFSTTTGHFTQVVWVGTRALGCATTSCGGMDIWVCNYAPPGNVQGGYGEHVLPESCR